MKTKVGKLLLKKHSKKIGQLDARFIDIAEELKSLSEVDNYTESLLEAARENRKEPAENQEVINLLCELENYLDLR